MTEQTADQTNGSGDSERLVGLTATVVSAFVGSDSNHVTADQVPGLIKDVHAALSGLSSSQPEQKELVPNVPIRKSVQPDFIVCLEDGKKLKMLKRYLKTQFNMTPDEYRAKWGLPADYPMVAPNYAETRRKLALDIGLGKKRTSTARRKATGTPGNGRRRATAKATPAKTGRGRRKTATA